MSIDKFLFRTYNRKTYNCAHFACEVWKDVTGLDISVALRGFLAGQGETTAILSDLRTFRNLSSPLSPCLVLFQSPRMGGHVGVFIRGKVLHIQPRGVEFQPIEVASKMFKKTGFYTC